MLNNLGEILDDFPGSPNQTHEAEKDDDDEEDQPLNAWVDFREALTEEEVVELDRSVQPVRSMLFKVC